MSPSSFMPQGAPRCRPPLCLTLRQPQATWLMARLHHLCPKTVPWRQGAQPHGTTRRVRRPRKKKEAAKKSLGHEKMPLHSLCHPGKTACRLRRWCADPIKDKFSTSTVLSPGDHGRLPRLHP